MHGGGTDSTGEPEAVGTQDQVIDIRDFAYAPGNVIVAAGSRVRWVNYDSAPHSATADDGSWDTGLLNQDEENTLTFTDSGEYEYYCTVHPSMRARLVVR